MILNVITEGGFFLFFGRNVSTPCRLMISEKYKNSLIRYCKKKGFKYTIEQNTNNPAFVQRGKRIIKLSHKPRIQPNFTIGR